MSSKKVKTVLGTMEFGKRLNLEQSEKMVSAFVESQRSTGAAEMDAAYMYAGGKTEEFMGKMICIKDDIVQIATKANPWDNKLLDAAGLRHQLETSLKRLNVDSVHLFYLHAPDHKTPIRETLRGVNELYNEKKFKEFGLSNYASWEVAEICTICQKNDWVMPKVYQGMYNALTRNVEYELFKCLRYFNMRFYAYNPLCGGLLTGKHKIEDASKTEPGRFFGKGWAEAYRKRYWKEEMFASIDKIKKVLGDVYGDEVTLTEASLRWVYHHSFLDGCLGDGVIIGASNMDHFNANLGYTAKDKLDEKVVQAFEEGWKNCCYICSDYMR